METPARPKLTPDEQQAMLDRKLTPMLHRGWVIESRWAKWVVVGWGSDQWKRTWQVGAILALGPTLEFLWMIGGVIALSLSVGALFLVYVWYGLIPAIVASVCVLVVAGWLIPKTEKRRVAIDDDGEVTTEVIPSPPSHRTDPWI